MDSQILQRRLLRSGLALLLTALLLLAASPLGAILAQTVIRTVQSWQLGENTTAVSVDGDFEALPGEAGDTVILPAIGTTTSPEEIVPVFEGDPGQERTIIFDSMVPLDAAQEQVSFPLKQPGFIPEGYELQGAVVIHPGQASLEYFSRQDSRMIGLLQTAVGGSDGEVQVTFTSDMVVQEVEVGGNPGLWTQVEDEGLLIWEAAGVNYQLAGLSERELALQVAKSIQ